jgi:hypothetical protein
MDLRTARAEDALRGNDVGGIGASPQRVGGRVFEEDQVRIGTRGHGAGELLLEAQGIIVRKATGAKERAAGWQTPASSEKRGLNGESITQGFAPRP